jgi:hypothetical protein
MSNLDKLMQMVTLEQLNNMVQQLHKTNTTKDTETKDVLSLPIVQKVIMAYEDELKNVKDVSKSCKCIDNTCLLHQIFDRLDKYNLNLQRIESKLNDLASLLETHTSSNYLSNQYHNSFVEDKNQTKLTSFPGFNHYVNTIDLTEADDSYEAEQFPEIKYIEIKNIEIKIEKVVEEKVVEVEKQNITLEIEEVAEDISFCDLVDHSLDKTIIKVQEVVEEVATEVSEEEVSEEEVSEEEVATDVSEDDVSEEEVATDVSEDEEAAEDKVAIEDEEVSEDVVEDDVVEEDVVEEVVEEDEDEEVFEIEIDDITYFATDEENGILYEVDKDGEVGKKVGIIKDGEPIFS